MGAAFSTPLCASVGDEKVPGGVHLSGPCVLGFNLRINKIVQQHSGGQQGKVSSQE